jgi:sulfur relay (sulfurtransferase) DsrF/TusC family protein
MSDHLFVESQGPWAGPGCNRFLEDALSLARAGHRVWLFLLENGVTAAIPGSVPALAELLDEGCQLWVDVFSMDQHTLRPGQLVPSAQLVGMDEVAEMLLRPGIRAIWH